LLQRHSCLLLIGCERTFDDETFVLKRIIFLAQKDSISNVRSDGDNDGDIVVRVKRGHIFSGDFNGGTVTLFYTEGFTDLGKLNDDGSFLGSSQFSILP